MVKSLLKQYGILFILTSVVLCGCSKDGATASDTGTGQGTNVYDLAGDTAASVGIEEGKTQRNFYPLLFDFATGASHLLKTAADTAEYVTNGDWDIAFTAQYNSTVIPNNGSYINTLGYGGAGSFIIMPVNAAFDDVNTAPSDDAMNASAMKSVGWDQGDGQGWFYYSTDNHICVAVTGRTFVFKTSAGLYGKVEFISIYKGHPPVVTDLFWPAPYLSFRYFLQKDGSKNLKTRS